MAASGDTIVVGCRFFLGEVLYGGGSLPYLLPPSAQAQQIHEQKRAPFAINLSLSGESPVLQVLATADLNK